MRRRHIRGRPVAGHRLTLGLALHQHPHQPRQPVNLGRLRRHDVGQVIHRPHQMRHLFFQRLMPRHSALRRLPPLRPSDTRTPTKSEGPTMPQDKSTAPKTHRPRAETPKGFRDYFGAEVTERKAMLDKVAEVYHRYGFDPLETSAVETVEALGKFLPDVDRPNEGVFAWQEEDQDWLALRYDLTAPLARVAAQYRNDLPSPYRRYAMGPVWRNEKPGPGRFRQFYQCDADTVGAPSVAADAEICAMLSDALETVGIPRGDYVVRVNNRKVLNGVMEVAGVLDPTDPDRFGPERGIVLRAIDKIDRLGDAGVRALLGEGRKDESGDFTKGAGLGAEQAEVVMAFMAARRATGAETTARLRELVGPSTIGTEGVDELETIADLLDRQGYGPDRIIIDPGVVRGLGYYTGPVFEAELTFEILDEKGRKRQLRLCRGRRAL